MNIVTTNAKYSYSLMVDDLASLKKVYPFLEFKIVGKSVLEKNIYVIKLGNGPNNVFYSASIHANEWITSILLMKFIEDYCEAYTRNSSLFGYSIKDIFHSSSIYLMPMVNPDGVDLVTGPISSSSPYFKNALAISKQFSNIPFPSGWKANIRGVDLNLQFPARME